MNWKAEAVERLRQYDTLRCAAGSLQTELKRLEEQLCDPGHARPDAPIKGSGCREDWLLNTVVSRGELEKRLQQTRSWLQATELALSALTPEERLILHRLYISPRKNGVEQLCQELETERSSVYRKRDKSLEHFTLALYGVR